MTESMLTKVARMTAERTGFKWEYVPQSNWRTTAKAAIYAMREPTDAMQNLALERGISLKDYQAMIDLILEEAPWPRGR